MARDREEIVPTMRSEHYVRDYTEILHILQSWGLLRDTRRFEELRTLFAPEAAMHTSSWGGLAEDFIDRAVSEKGGAGKSQHIFGGGHIEIVGDRALADSRMLVISRRRMREADLDLTGRIRLLDKFVRTSEGWRLLERFPLYEQSRIDFVDTGHVLPIDLGPFADHPEGLRHVAFVQAASGRPIPEATLAMHGEGFAAFEAARRKWLAG